MAILRVQATGGIADNTTSIVKAYASNVTAGNLLVVVAMGWSASNDAWVVGDISKSAGAATLGDWTLDKGNNYNIYGSYYNDVAIFSAPVTGTGACTITVAGKPSGSYFAIGLAEFSGADTSATRVDATNANQTNVAGKAGDSGSCTSAGAGVFVAGIALNLAQLNTVVEDAAYSNIFEEGNGAAHVVASSISQIVSGATTDTATWTWGYNGGWSAAQVVYKEAAAASGRNPVSMGFDLR